MILSNHLLLVIEIKRSLKLEIVKLNRITEMCNQIIKNWVFDELNEIQDVVKYFMFL